MKIALCGSAPSSLPLTAGLDDSWEIWGCSPGAYGAIGPKSHVWFEMHRWEPQIPGHLGTGKSWFSPEYCEFLCRHPKVYTAEPIPDMANGVVYPFKEMLDKYGPYFFTSSLSWMLALAMEVEGITEIGLFGVDMSAHEEYNYQRPGCHHFLTLAMQRGIKITVPPESDILQPPFLYGLGEISPMMIKLTARRNELQSRMFAANQRIEQARDESSFIRGALDDLDYMIKTWVTHQTLIETTDTTPSFK